jgi:hypothetical protein
VIWIPIASEIADLALFPLAAGMVAVGLLRWRTDPRQKKLLAGTMVLTVVAKVLLALPGHNYDVEAYRFVSDIQEHGGSIYADSAGRYNYGPIWAWIVAGFGHLAPNAASESFHLWIAAFLATVDVWIAWLIARTYSSTAALVFLLCPVGFLISGYHSQFDNLAVLLGLLAWLAIQKGNPRIRTLLLSAALLGVSLIVKHLLILFPLWLLFWKPLGGLWRRVLYGAIVYGMFFGSFLPWWNDPASRAGISQYVFGYNSFYGVSWLGYMVGLLVPIPTLDAWLSWVPLVKGLEGLWLAGMAGAGWLLSRREGGELYLLYLLALYASSPAVASQYTAIPLVAVAVYCAATESWAFFGAATVADLVTATGLGGLLILRALVYFNAQAITIGEHAYFVNEVLEQKVYPFFVFSSQFCAGALLFRLWRHGEIPRVEQAWVRKAGRGAGLVALGGLPIVLVVVDHFIR